MSDNEFKQFSYFFRYWVDSSMLLVIWILSTILLLSSEKIIGIILGLVLIIIFLKKVLNIIRNLCRSVAGKPALEITDQYFINHMNKTKIHWKNINKIKRVSVRGYESLDFELNNRKNYIAQIKDPVEKILFILAPSKLPIRVIISYIRGDNDKIYQEINSGFIKKSNYY